MSSKQPLCHRESRRLLDLLCGDDHFRYAFAADPGAAMAMYHLQPLARTSACALQGSLASKEEFKAARTLLETALSAHAAFNNPHFFEAGEVADQVNFNSGERVAA